jgi:hypothetical protein
MLCRDAAEMRPRGALLTAALILSAAALGCQKSGLVMVPVSGTVTLDGETLQPERGAGRVIFYPNTTAQELLAKGDADNPDAGRMAVGDIKPDGTYSVSTYQPGDGLAVGSYSVAVVLLADSPGTPARAKKGKDGGLPAKYSSAQTSGFVFTADPSDSSRTLDLELESDGTESQPAKPLPPPPAGKNL